ncbi:piggyBac transposable element-derived protein 4-like [Salarias fasciatus]|uniref:PiggyBac transposable element-derived protein 4-like n=1 Tax=Salarias fasciatus TaxID=181472 RepID=A0A672GSS6_SALFA|nr:piggyBac transposable element-derived protein 4-like [Salarias fasciatus]
MEEEEGNSICMQYSSSEDEDLLFPDNPIEDVDYTAPLSFSESDEEYELPKKTPRKKRGRRTAPGESQPSAPPPTTEKRRRSSLENSTAATQPTEKPSAPTGSETRWRDRDEEDSKPVPFRFVPARTPGPTFPTTTAWSPLSLFQLFFSASVVQKIIDNTNKNAVRRKNAGLKYKWEELTMKEFYVFMAILLFTSLVSVHHRSDYWRKKWPYNFSFPGDHMTRDRFEAIMCSLHLSDPKEDEENEEKKHTAEYDRLFKLKPLYTEIVNACKAHFHPYQNISIDERMVGSKARISIKQYMKNKPTKWGYKLFVLADSVTGYTWNFFIYTGKSESSTPHGLSYSSVMDLMPFSALGSGYTLYTDNFYTSPALFTDLLAKKIGSCGTIRQNRIGLPQTLTNDLPKTAERGDIRWVRNGQLLYVKWMDTRQVAMCSTVHQAYSGQTVTRKLKEAGVWTNKVIPVPDSIKDYNCYMGGVDLSDALIKSYSIHNKAIQWYKTFFFHFVDIATVNSYLLHKEVLKLQRDPSQTQPLTHKLFKEKLAQEMLEFAVGLAAPPPPSTSCMPLFNDSQEGRARRYCKRCHDTGTPRVKTAVVCRKCQVPLCLTSKRNCFQLWHDGQ